MGCQSRRWTCSSRAVPPGTNSTGGATARFARTSGQVYVPAPLTSGPGPLKRQPAGSQDAGSRYAAQSGGGALTLQTLAAELNAEDCPPQPSRARADVVGQPAAVLTQQDGVTIAWTAGQPVALPVENEGTGAKLSSTDHGKTHEHRGHARRGGSSARHDSPATSGT